MEEIHNAIDTGSFAAVEGSLRLEAIMSSASTISQRPDSPPEFVLVPGLRDSGPAHWQTHWEMPLAARRVVQDDAHVGELERWSARVVEVASRGRRDVVLVAHSFGCLAAVHAAPRLVARLRALMLVAPASPSKFDVGSKLRDTLDVPSLLVASHDDPWLDFDDARALARRWSSRLHDLGHAGHINSESGYGPWPEGRELLTALVDVGTPARAAA